MNILDERYILHRYKSTSHAGVACAVMLGGWVLYEYYARDTLHVVPLAILGLTALIKVGFLTYFRLRD